MSRRVAVSHPQQLALFDPPVPAQPGADRAAASDSIDSADHPATTDRVQSVVGPEPASVTNAPAAGGTGTAPTPARAAASVATAAAVPFDAALAPVAFRHPNADREIRLQTHRVAYALRRARRRSIGFVVGVEGLSVSAPRWVGVRDIEAALHEKAGWILRKLHEQRDRAARLQAAKVEWRDGTQLPYLGRTLTVVLDARAGVTPGGAVLDAGAAEAGDETVSLELHVGLPRGAMPTQIRDVVQSWLQRQARRVFDERCRHFAAELGVRMTRLTLSSAQTRWGSASANGSIRLNWRLIHFALPSIDYVVAHELAHLREMNHSPRFWDIVRSVLPDYEQARGTLKDGLVPLLD